MMLAGSVSDPGVPGRSPWVSVVPSALVIAGVSDLYMAFCDLPPVVTV